MGGSKGVTLGICVFKASASATQDTNPFSVESSSNGGRQQSLLHRCKKVSGVTGVALRDGGPVMAPPKNRTGGPVGDGARLGPLTASRCLSFSSVSRIHPIAANLSNPNLLPSSAVKGASLAHNLAYAGCNHSVRPHSSAIWIRSSGSWASKSRIWMM